MRKPRLNRLHDDADGERHAERRRVAAEEQAEAGRRQRVGGDQDALRKAGRAARPFQRALGLLGVEFAVLHLAGDFVDHRNAPAVRAAAADAPHARAPVRLQKNRRRERRDVDLLHAKAPRHAPRRFLHAVGFAAVFQQKLRRRADNIQLLFVCLHTIPLYARPPDSLSHGYAVPDLRRSACLSPAQRAASSTPSRRELFIRLLSV